MKKRVNTAFWVEKEKRWCIAVQKNGTRKRFYSSTPGRTGQREANAKADAWLDDSIRDGKKKVSVLYERARVFGTVIFGQYRILSPLFLLLI